MRHNINFILPKIAGFTIIAGVGALVLFMLFKVLILALFVSVGVFAVKSAAMMIRQARARYGYDDDYDEKLAYRDFYETLPISTPKSELAIIPIK